jgi:hypothetical protein
MVRLASLFALMTPVSRAKGFLHLICWLFIWKWFDFNSHSFFYETSWWFCYFIYMQ